MGNNESTNRPIVTRKLISLITKNGFVNKKGTKHGKYERDGDSHVIMVPRHKNVTSGLSKRMCKELIELHGFSKKDILKLF